MKTRFFAAFTVLLLSGFAIMPASNAADAKKPTVNEATTNTPQETQATVEKDDSKDLSKEDRLKMANVHSKMAACLKSNTPIRECRKEMRRSCMDKMGKNGCPMMKGKGQNMRPKGDDEDED